MAGALAVVFVRMNDFPVAIARGSHPIPSRTRKLSPSAPMVLRGKLRGRVGRRRSQFSKRPVHPWWSGRSRLWGVRRASRSGGPAARDELLDLRDVRARPDEQARAVVQPLGL